MARPFYRAAVPAAFAFFAFIVAAFLACSSASAALSDDAKARLLAGRPSNDPEAAAIQSAPAWQAAARSATAVRFDAPGSFLSPDSLRTLAEFGASAFPEAHSNSRRVLYLFGGADFPMPSALLPEMEEIVLVGLEPVGRLADVSAMSRQGSLSGTMTAIGTAFHDLATYSYFITVNMARQIGAFGVSSMLAIGAAARGYEIGAVEPISIDAAGRAVANPTSQQGARIRAVSPRGRETTIYYLRQDLSNQSLASNPGFEQFLRDQRFDTAFYKAASFVSHDSNFTRIVSFVTDTVRYVLQSDDGLPWRSLDKSRWDIKLYGLYIRPGPIFRRGWENDLLQSFASSICDAGDRQAVADMNGAWAIQGLGNDLCRRFAGAPRDHSVKWMGYVPFRFGYSPFNGTATPAGVKERSSNLIYAVAR